MKILLVSATQFEILPLLHGVKKKSSGNGLNTCTFGKNSVDVLITGVGMTAMAFHLGKILGRKYDLAINAGVAGSFRRSISPGTVVNVVKDSFADLGAEDGEKFLTLREMGLAKGASLKAQGRWKGSKILSNLSKVDSITVNTVHGNAANIKKIIRKFNPDIESMEGAAFFFACNNFKMPCIQIRAVSNYVERRNKKAWKLMPAIENLNAFLEEMLASV